MVRKGPRARGPVVKLPTFASLKGRGAMREKRVDSEVGENSTNFPECKRLIA